MKNTINTRYSKKNCRCNIPAIIPESVQIPTGITYIDHSSDILGVLKVASGYVPTTVFINKIEVVNIYMYYRS